MKEALKPSYQVTTDLNHLALVSKRLLPIVQELLYRSPLLFDIGDGEALCDECPIIMFIRLLIAMPHLRKLVKQLRLAFPMCNFPDSRLLPPEKYKVKFKHI